MTRVAVVGWATDSGVGRELVDAGANLPISGAFLLTHAQKRNRFELIPEEVRQVSGGLNPIKEMEDFIEKFRPDAILTWEGPGRWEFPDLWRQKGIRWVNVIHWDWFPTNYVELLKQADLVAPNKVCQEGLKAGALSSTLLPVPLDISKFPFKERSRADRFGMAYGAGGPHGRRALAETLAALEKLADPPPFVVKAQAKCPEYRDVKKATLVVENVYDPAELYADIDVAIQPSKFEGVGLSLLEAQASGVPVITVDAEPMRTLAPDLLVGASSSNVSTMDGNKVVAWTPDITALSQRIAGLRKVEVAYLSRKARKNAERFSWDILKADWKKFLGIG